VKTSEQAQTGIPLEQIGPNPFQPRRAFNPEQLAELARSIASQGLLQPLVVAQADGEAPAHPFVLIAGERRLRAARIAGLTNVPCVVKQATKQQMLEWALIENIHRTDLNPVERAGAYRQYVDQFGLTQADAADRLGQPRATVANYLRLLDLSSDIREMVAAGALSFGHAKVLAGLVGSPEQFLSLARKTVAEELSVRALEVLVARSAGLPDQAQQQTGRPARMKPAYVLDLEEQLTQAVGTRVTILPGRAKHTGRVVVEYYSLDDFDRIAGLLGLKVQS
jgi:ParB family chromosome partitioning protein